MLCVLISSSSVAILAVLLLSILYRGIPAFFPPTQEIDQEIVTLEESIENLQTQIASASLTEKPALRSKLNGLEAELIEVGERRDRVAKSFLKKPPAPDPLEAGIGPALLGSIWVCVGCAVFFLPLGVSTAIYLEEFKPRNRFLLWFSNLLQLNISNLAGVPSIVYGILGLTAFASMFGLFGSPNEPALELGTTFSRQYLTEGMEVVFLPVSTRDEIPELADGMEAKNSAGETVVLNIIGPDDEFPEADEELARSLFSDAEGGVIADNAWYSFRLPFGRSVLAASLTLMLVILPVVVIASQEALRSVPSSLRQGAQGLGCTRLQVVRHVTLPSAIPGIMTGSILAMSRAIGEAAPILMIAGLVYITTGPQHLMDDFAVLPLQIFYWAGLPIDQESPLNFQHVAAGGIIVLLLVLFAFNFLAITVRQYAQKQLT